LAFRTQTRTITLIDVHGNGGAVLRRQRISSDHVRDNLWNDAVDHSAYSGHSEKYQSAVMDQYKLYVEMTDRISARRATTNTFFLLINSSIFAALGSVGRRPSWGTSAVLVLAVVVLLVECGAWYWILRSYQQLSSAKFRVIGALEERLPAGPWYRAEWTAVGAGRDGSRYLPMTRIEQCVPIVFALAYLTLLIILLVDS
jgi:hypothetical protein